MANLAIIDSGFILSDRTGTQIDAADRANAGVELTLSGGRIKRNAGTGFDDSPVPGLKSDVEINTVSTSNPRISLDCMIDRTVLDTDIDYLFQLDRMRKTNGMKLLFHSTTQFGKGVTQATNVFKDVIDSFGDVNKDDAHTGSGKELAATTPHLHVQLVGIEGMTDDPDPGKITFKLMLVETA